MSILHRESPRSLSPVFIKGGNGGSARTAKGSSSYYFERIAFVIISLRILCRPGLVK